MRAKPSILGKIVYRGFEAPDYLIYKLWFEDEELNFQLGPIDEAWLEAILNEPSSRQYSFHINNQLIGILGLYLPEKSGDPVFLTEVAIRPDLRNRGYGSKIISLIQTAERLKTFPTWKASIHKDNIAAQRMLTRLGWELPKKLPASQDYIDVTFKPKAD